MALGILGHLLVFSFQAVIVVEQRGTFALHVVQLARDAIAFLKQARKCLRRSVQVIRDGAIFARDHSSFKISICPCR